MSFTDFHNPRFVVLAFDFLHGFLHKYGVQLQHLPPNVVSQLAGFVIMCESFLGIAPNMDLFQRVFEVKTLKVHGSNGDVLAPVGGRNLQMHHGVSHGYPCLPLKSLNSGRHGHWFYIQNDVATPFLLPPVSHR